MKRKGYSAIDCTSHMAHLLIIKDKSHLELLAIFASNENLLQFAYPSLGCDLDQPKAKADYVICCVGDHSAFKVSRKSQLWGLHYTIFSIL